MRVLAAPNALKGSLTASQVASAMKLGVQRAAPEIRVDEAPIADGGDGLQQVLGEARGGSTMRTRVTGPLGTTLDARWSWLEHERLAVVEMAEASGLAIIPDARRDPLGATTFGVGQLLRAAADHGARRIILGIGGSATSDGGAGMAEALGVRFLDASGHTLPRGGGGLIQLHSVDSRGLDPRFRHIQIEVACDVDNPLLGPTGAARMFSPQKGADALQTQLLEAALSRYADVLETHCAVSVRDRPGVGAAGGLGAGLMLFLGARLRRGTELVFEQIGLQGRVEAADLVLTAEGRVDEQTGHGKAPAAVATLAANAGVACVCIAGSVAGGLDALHARGLTAAFACCQEPMSLEQSMQKAATLIARTSEQVIRLVVATRQHARG